MTPASLTQLPPAEVAAMTCDLYERLAPVEAPKAGTLSSLLGARR